jgi:hypothetical protein
VSGGRGATTDESRGNAVNGRTEVTERRQATGGPPRRVPRRAAAAGPRRPAAPADARQPRPADANGAGVAKAGTGSAGVIKAGAGSTRQADGRRAVARPPQVRPGTRPGGARPAAAPQIPRRGRQGSTSGTARAARPPQSGQRHAPHTRTRFVFLVVGLLGGGLLSLLMINTILATGAFQITALQQGNVVLAQREQALQAQVAAQESPATLAQRAASLGMRVQPRLHFLNLKKGQLESEPNHMPGMPAIPGYTP